MLIKVVILLFVFCTVRGFRCPFSFVQYRGLHFRYSSGALLLERNSHGQDDLFDLDLPLNVEPDQELQLSPSQKFSETDSTSLPLFALLYKFKSEFSETGAETAIADHNGYCENFKRLINSEMIKTDGGSGFVLLWAGLSPNDKDETKAEVLDFIREDPLILSNKVDSWDLVDLADHISDFTES